MEIKNIYHIAQRAMGAQLVRLNAIASNLANADNIAGSPEDAYKPVKPVFETKYFDLIRKKGISTVAFATVPETRSVIRARPKPLLTLTNWLTIELPQKELAQVSVIFPDTADGVTSTLPPVPVPEYRNKGKLVDER